MKRRNFIKNTGLSIAGLTLANGIFGKNIKTPSSLNIIILVSGGVRYNDVINYNKLLNENLFSIKNSLNVACYTQLKYTGREIEHANCLLHAISNIHNVNGRNLLLTSKKSASETLIKKAQLPIEVIAIDAAHTVNPYKYDEAIFDEALKYLSPNENINLILNLEDTDIAHYNAYQYHKVLDFYFSKINNLCETIFENEFLKTFNTSLTLASVMGRNNFSNEIITANLAGNDHYDESARDLFCIKINAAAHPSINYYADIMSSNDLFQLVV
jgi:hypothetical protein